MYTKEMAIDLMRDYVAGVIGVKEFSANYIRLWRALRDSGQIMREELHVQRGLGVVLTSIDAFDTDVSNEDEVKQRELILFSEVRAVLSVIRP